jgi:DNA polymerase-3 subunit alpha
MPLINSKGVRQTPWSEGQNVRHLEPMGFIKFDLLGLSTLRMVEGAIRHVLKRHHDIEEPTYQQIKEYYDNNLHPDKIDLDDQDVYENIFHAGKWAGVFQFTETGAQDFCKRAKPKSIIDLAAITSIYRPGPLSAGVDRSYVNAKENPLDVKYLHPLVEEHTKETYGFLIFQEQIAMLAHKLGKDVSLDEGNLLRKVLTKKGTGKGAQAKRKIHGKFIAGCVEKGIRKMDAEELWKTFEYFSGYGFNKSHAVSYCVLSYQCAWLLNYYPAEWVAAFLDKEPETRKEKAINIAKSQGFEIEGLNINTSGKVWEISDDGKTLIQPLSSCKGIGDAAIDQIVAHRPYNTIEEFLFNEEMVYSKVNKRVLDILIRSGAMDPLIDDRFTGGKHFWSAVAVERPRNQKKLDENIELYKPEGKFSEEEKIEYLVDLTGVFPMEKVITGEVLRKLQDYGVPPLGEYDPDLQLSWFIPRAIIPKKTKNGKDYWILECIDDTSTLTKVRCWGVNPNKDRIFLNRPYMAKLNYDPNWGFSTRAIGRTFRLLG